MRIVNTILQKVLVNYFYRVNAGFFLFGFFVLFGLPVSPLAFHLSLITGIIQSQVFLAVVMLMWTMYNLKCIDYILKQLNDPRQSFLFCLNSLPPRTIYICMLQVQAFAYLPVLLYSGVIAGLAFQKQQYLCLIEVLIFDIIIVASTAFVYVSALQKRQLFVSKLRLPSLKISIPKPFFSIPLYFLWNDRKQMLFVTKLFSLLLLFGFFNLYETHGYDIRPLQLCLLITAASHSAVVFELRAFEEDYLSFYRNLPINIVGRFLRIIATCACLLLPEFIFLFKGVHVHFVINDYPQLVLQLILLLCIFHVVLLMEHLSMEQFIRAVFGILAGCFFILLYNPGWILHLSIVLLAFALFSAYYYDYEKKYN